MQESWYLPLFQAPIRMPSTRECRLSERETASIGRFPTDTETADGEFATLAKVVYTDHGMEKHFDGIGNGPIDAVQRGLEDALGIHIKVLDYTEHAMASGSGAQAASYIHLVDQTTGKATYGVGISSNITRASIRGIFSAVNRLFY